MIHSINSFSQIKIKPNSLVVLDIDDTILHFSTIKKGWWTETFNKYYEIFENYDEAKKLAYHDWENLVIT
jgi:hypothetical protein